MGDEEMIDEEEEEVLPFRAYDGLSSSLSMDTTHCFFPFPLHNDINLLPKESHSPPP